MLLLRLPGDDTTAGSSRTRRAKLIPSPAHHLPVEITVGILWEYMGTLLPTSQKRASALQGGGRRCSFARWDPHRALALADAGALLCGAVRSRSFSCQLCCPPDTLPVPQLGDEPFKTPGAWDSNSNAAIGGADYGTWMSDRCGVSVASL